MAGEVSAGLLVLVLVRSNLGDEFPVATPLTDSSVSLAARSRTGKYRRSPCPLSRVGGEIANQGLVGLRSTRQGERPYSVRISFISPHRRLYFGPSIHCDLLRIA
jgi:hypothetical protein